MLKSRIDGLCRSFFAGRHKNGKKMTDSMEAMRLTAFSPEAKIRAFDRIAACCLNHNFGTLGKADFELLLFSIYLDNARETGAPTDDYTISRELGLTQQRVRGLKIKQHLRDGNDIDWKRMLAQQASKPHYSQDERYIMLTFDEPAVMIEVQHYIEQKGGFVDFSFNPKVLKMPIQSFALLMVELGIEKDEEACLKTLNRIWLEENDEHEKLTKPTMQQRLKNGSIKFLKSAVNEVALMLINGGLSGMV